MKKSDKTTAFQLISRILPAFFILSVFAASGWGQEEVLNAWNTNGLSGITPDGWEATTNADNVSKGEISRGTGITATSLTNGFAASGWDVADLEAAKSGNKYFAFFIESESNYELSLTEVSFRTRRTSTGPNRLQLAYSVNGTDFIDIGDPIVYENTTDGFAHDPIDLSEISALQEAEKIYFRLYGWGASSSGGTLAFGRTGAGTNDLIINGIVELSGPPTQVATPSINPGTGTFYAPFDVEITTSTDDATVFYSFDSDEGPWIVYDDENRPNISETTTIWAYAEKAGMDDSDVANAIYTFPIEVASIEALQDIGEIGGLYRITGEVFMSYQNDSRNQKYFQDELDGGRGIKIDDPNGNLTTVLNIGDGVTNLTGTIGQFNRMIQFTPIEGQSPESPNTTGNTLTPFPVTLAEVIDENNIITVAGQEISVFQALLIEIEDLQFEQAGDFDSGASFGELPISDPTASLVDINAADFGVLFRVEYADLEYNGDPIPQVPLTLTAIVDQRLSNARIFARDWNDFDIPDPLLFVSPATISNLDYIVDDGPSDPQSFQLTGINLDGTDVTVNAPADFEISEDGTKTFGPTITLSAYDGTEKTILVRLEENLPVDTYVGNVTTAGGGVAVGDEATVAVSGEVTAPPVTEVPFETKFGTDENWDLISAAGSYGEKAYEEGGWYFNSTHAVRGTLEEEVFDGSSFAFRCRGDFTVYNQAPLAGMTGFSFQFRNWMTGAGLDRDFRISLDGGASWTTIETMNLNWFTEPSDGEYEEYIYYFEEEKAFDAEEFRIEILGGNNNNNGRINIGQFKALDEEPPLAQPIFDLAAGTYFEDQTVVISNFPAYAPGVTVYYTTDGNDPDDQSNEYDHNAGIELEDGNGPITLKAIAIDGEEESDITSAVYTFPLNVDDIEQLRQQTLGNLYRVDNPSVFIGGTSFRNTKFFQDDSGFGIQIDDLGTTPVIDTDYDIGDQVAELVGTLGQFQNQLQFSPALDPGAPIDTGVEIIPVERTLDDLTQDDQSRLVVVYNVIFEDGDGIETFGGGGTTTNITDPSIDGFGGLFRNVFGDSDITGSVIPEGPVNITGIIQENDAGLNLAARNLDDFEQDNGTITNLNDGIQYATLQHAVDAASPGDKIKFKGEFEDLDASDSEVILAPGTSSGCATFTDTYTLSSTETLEIEINGPVPCDDHDQIEVGTVLTLGGADLDIDLGFAPGLFDTFVIMTYGTSIDGEFAQGGEITAIYDGLIYTFSIEYGDGDVTLEVTGIEDLVAIPIAPWAILLLFGLMGAFVLRRFRR